MDDTIEIYTYKPYDDIKYYDITISKGFWATNEYRYSLSIFGSDEGKWGVALRRRVKWGQIPDIFLLIRKNRYSKVEDAVADNYHLAVQIINFYNKFLSPYTEGSDSNLLIAQLKDAIREIKKKNKIKEHE